MLFQCYSWNNRYTRIWTRNFSARASWNDIWLNKFVGRSIRFKWYELFFLLCIKRNKKIKKNADAVNLFINFLLIYFLGEGGSVILWDAAARKAKWSHVLHGEIVNCVTVSTITGKFRYHYDLSGSIYWALNITQYKWD